MSTLPVLCCCNADNELGTLPEDLPYDKRAWVDEEGNEGLAFPSSAIPSGVELGKGGKKGGGKKGGGRKGGSKGPRKRWK